MDKQLIARLNQIRKEALERGEYVSFTSGERLVAIPFTARVWEKDHRVYLGDAGDLYYRRGRCYYTLGNLRWFDTSRLSYSPPGPKKRESCPGLWETFFDPKAAGAV